jgi:Carboxypeptidase regulatory-like domain
MLLLAMAWAQPGVGGRLSGTVVDTDSGVPIPLVTITVRLALSGAAATTAVTDAAGRYGVVAPGAGPFLVTASKPGYVTATFGRRHEIDDGGQVELTPGQSRSRVDFQLSREAVLAGRVVGPNGEGLAGLLIRVARPHVVAGRRRLLEFASARSDAAGDYGVRGLLPGDYYVSVSLFEREDSRAAKYAPTFYPRSADVASALPVRLNAGITTRIDAITPLPVPWTRLTGRLKTRDGHPLMNGALVMQPGDPAGLSFSPDAVSEIFPDGRFTFDFVVPGHYLVRAQGKTSDSGLDLFAAWFVDVSGQPIGEQTMTLEPGSDVSGVVRFNGHGTHQPADLASIRVWKPLVDGTNFAPESETHVRRNGSFRLTSVDAGQRLIRVDGLPYPWSLERVLRAERTVVDVTDVPIDIQQGQKLENVQIILTDVVTGITGDVRTRSGEPIAHCLVVIFPENRDYWRPLSRYILATRTDWEGHYRLASLPAGAYRVAAATDVEEGEIYQIDVLDQLTGRSVAASLIGGEMRQQPLVVTIGQRSAGQ